DWRGGGEGAEAAVGAAGAGRLRADTAVHRDAGHAFIRAVAGKIARDVLDHSPREQPHGAEPASADHHLVESRHRPRRPEAPAMRPPGLSNFGAVVARLGIWRGVNIGAALLFLGRNTDEKLVDETERSDH